jgi:hypothetical protein
LPGKISLGTAYKADQVFFQLVLKIVKPTLEMHIRALIRQTEEDYPDKGKILQEIINICALNPTAEILQKRLSDFKCLPVREKSGALIWLTPNDHFAIVDRRDYGRIFRDEIRILDFSLEEVHAIKKFLIGLELEERYMSKAVIEETKVQDGQLHERLTADLRKKTYAVCR